MNRHSFEYATIRVVPRVDRGEFLNVGVVLYCQQLDYLAAKTSIDPQRLGAVFPGIDLTAVSTAIAAFTKVCAGCSPSNVLGLGARFRWITAPRSTIIQTGPTHTGITSDPEAELGSLLRRLVL